MVNYKSLLAATLVGFAALADAKHVNKKCKQNACLSTVKFGGMPSGPGACNSFFRTILTPDPTTRFVTKSKTTTVTNTATITSSFSTTTTSTSTSTSTSTTTTTVFSATSTSTSVSTTISTTITTTDTTSTSTFTIPSAPGCDQKLLARTVTSSATTVPAYASKACHGNTASYSSACSCIGATHSTSTAPTPTRVRTTHILVTATVSTTITTSVTSTESTSAAASTTTTTTATVSTDTTTTATTTTTSVTTSTSYTTTITSTVTSCPQPQATFQLVAESGPFSNDDAYVTSMDENGIVIFSPTTYTLFTRDPQCNLIDTDTGYIANIDDLASSVLYLNSAGAIAAGNYDPVICIPSADSDTIACNSPTNANNPTTLQTCGRSLYLGTSVNNGCNALTLEEVDQSCPT